MFWTVVRRTLLLFGSAVSVLLCAGMAGIVSVLWRDLRYQTDFIQSASASDPVVYAKRLWFFGPASPCHLLLSAALFGLCLAIAMLWSWLTQSRHQRRIRSR